MQRRVFCLVGPTAVGKTEVAARILAPRGGTIVSADARQIYKFLDIGTNKPGPALRQRVSFVMLDLVTPEQPFSAADFARAAQQAITELSTHQIPFMVVGGAGFYLRALFEPLFPVPRDHLPARSELSQLDTSALHEELMRADPETAARLHPHDRQRILRALEVFELTGKTMSTLRREQNRNSELIPHYVALDLPRQVLRRRIDQRLEQMVTNGLIAEVQGLLRMGYDERTPALNAIGYQEIIAFLNGQMTLPEALARAKKRSWDYARRQLTWFRHLSGVTWIDASDHESAVRAVEQRFAEFIVGGDQTPAIA